jgi:hypothetical protein
MGRAYTYKIGLSHNGQQVYVGIIGSIAGNYLSRQPHLVAVIKDLLLTLDLTRPRVTVSQDMGLTIGNTHIVATGMKDAVFYANPVKKSNSLRFVKNRSMEPSREVSVVLQRDAEGDYELMEAWVGPLYPPFPDASDASAESKAYWQTHAFVAGSELIEAQSITAVCPY